MSKVGSDDPKDTGGHPDWHSRPYCPPQEKGGTQKRYQVAFSRTAAVRPKPNRCHPWLLGGFSVKYMDWCTENNEFFINYKIYWGIAFCFEKDPTYNTLLPELDYKLHEGKDWVI